VSTKEFALDDLGRVLLMPEDMVRKIDTVAKKRGMSRSSFLVHAAQNAISSNQNSKPL